jgi:hypothetical protein
MPKDLRRLAHGWVNFREMRDGADSYRPHVSNRDSPGSENANQLNNEADRPNTMME